MPALHRRLAALCHTALPVRAWGRQMRFAAVAIVGGTLLSAVPTLNTVQAQSITLLRVATGPTGGTLFPVGGAIANAISNPPGSQPCERGGSCGVPGVIASAQSTQGSVDNVRLLLNNEVQVALIHANVAFAALLGRLEGQAQGARSLRAIGALYSEALQVVMAKDGRFNQLSDLAGARLSLGQPGSGGRHATDIVIEALDLGPVLKQGPDLAPGPAAEALLEGRIDGFVTVDGLPSPTVAELASSYEIAVLPLTGFDAARVIERHGFFERQIIEADTYEAVPETETLGLRTLLVVREDMDTELAKALTEALWHPTSLALYDRTLPDGVTLNPNEATQGIALKLHEGAAAFYETQQEDDVTEEEISEESSLVGRQRRGS